MMNIDKCNNNLEQKVLGTAIQHSLLYEHVISGCPHKTVVTPPPPPHPTLPTLYMVEMKLAIGSEYKCPLLFNCGVEEGFGMCD